MHVATSFRSPLPLRRWSIPLLIVALGAIVLGLIIGIRGLFGNPVRSTDSSGVTTLQGSFFPYDCGHGGCRGYVQEGGRSVFVVLPSSCPEPARDTEVTVQARRAPELGRESYTATGCARPI